jgi:PAS domain S-box-containing protein
LRASEERFHIAVESIPDAFAILSPVRDARGEIIDFRYEYANDATCALLELEREQLLGHSVCELFSWFRDSERFALYRRAALTREPVVSNYVPGQSALAGSRFTDSALNTVIVSMGENIVLLSRDVTDHWNTERELELRAELLDLAHDAVIVREPSESRVRFWNREAQSVYGYSAQEAIGRVTHELLATVFPESREAADEALARDGHWDGELRHRRKDGSEILVSSRQAMQNDPDGHPLAIIELNSDITAQRQAEHDLLDSRAQLAEAERIARIGSWQWNLTDDHIICSAGLLEIYGLTPDEFAAGFQGINQRVYPDDRELVSRALERAIDERSSFTADYRVIRSDGRVRTVRSHGEIVVDETGQPSRAIGIVQDITEAKLAHEALRSTSVDLERRAAELQQIALSTAQEPPAAAHAPLTARQSEILQLIAQGLTNAAIAERLVLTEGTVKWHVSQILTKTNTSNRVEAIARVLGMRP